MSRSYATAAIYDDDEAPATFEKINDQVVQGSVNTIEVQPWDGKLDVRIRLKDYPKRFYARISVIDGRDAAISAKIPLDVVISSTALRTVVNFEPGSGNSTVTAYIEAEINNHSGQEILFNGTGR